MSPGDCALSKVEQPILGELLQYHASLADQRALGTASMDEGSAREPRPSSSAGRWLEKGLMSGIIAAAATLAIVMVTRLVHATTGALAATPAPLTYHAPAGSRGARVMLLGLAATASRTPSAPEIGKYSYVKTYGWYRDTQVSRSSATSAVIPTETQTWLAPDGSGRLLRKALNATAAGQLLGVRPNATLDNSMLPAPAARPWRVTATTPALAARQLDVDHPRSDGPVQRFVALQDLALEEPIPPEVRAAILTVLADSKGLTYRGIVTDRLGRSGLAFSLDSSYSGGPERYTYIFDHTGALLDDEETVLSNVRALHVRRGAVIAYTVFATAAPVRSTTSLP